MSYSYSFVNGEGKTEYTIAVDYNMVGYAVHSYYKTTLTPEAAQDLVDDLTQALEWSKHPLFIWAEKKVKDRL